MKLVSFGIFFFVSFFVLNSTHGDDRVDGACDVCVELLDFKHTELALKQIKCDESVNLKGLKNGAKLIRSLVCKCDRKNAYEPKNNDCIKLYNDGIFIFGLQNSTPQIIKGIHKELSACSTSYKDICEVVQIYIDYMTNLSFCGVGVLAYQGERVEGKAVEFHVDTCYRSASAEFKDAVTAFNKKVPGTKDKINEVVTKGLAGPSKVFYGSEFRKCLSRIAGQYSEFCDC